jgi:hypothetical protein
MTSPKPTPTAAPKKRGRPSRATTSASLTTAGTTEVLPAAVADEVVDEVVASLNGLARSAGFEFARAAGRLILEKFYKGDFDAWRSRGAKDASFRKLASRADQDELHVSAPALYRAVALVELEERLGVSTWKHLTTSHVRAVFGLAEHHQQKLLSDAEGKGWTVEDMEKAAAKVRKKEGDGRGRPALPKFVKAIGRLKKMLDEKDELFGDMERIEQLEADEATALYQAVTGMKIHCEALQKALQAKVPGMA